MEDVVIFRFLAYGYGSGDGSGYGDDSGYGYGYGDGIKTFSGERVHRIDGVDTLIDSIHGNIAKCRILRKDLSTTNCYVAKVGNFFGHGYTIHNAVRAAQDKYNENRPLSERIADFIAKHPTLDSVCKNSELFEAHHTLTGSCLMGRREFARDHEIDVENGSMTVAEFIELTKDSYGSNAVRQLHKAYLNN